MEKESKNYIKGQAMVLTALIIGGALLAITTVAGYLMAVRIRQGSDIVNSTKAIFAAEAGIEWELYKLFKDPNAERPSFSNGASIDRTTSEADGKITSRGRSGNSLRSFEMEFGGLPAPVVNQPPAAPEPVSQSGPFVVLPPAPSPQPVSQLPPPQSGEPTRGEGQPIEQYAEQLSSWLFNDLVTKIQAGAHNTPSFYMLYGAGSEDWGNYLSSYLMNRLIENGMPYYQASSYGNSMFRQVVCEYYSDSPMPGCQ